MSKQFTANEVKEQGSVEKGLHIIIDNNVYKLDTFVDEHPGGAKILKRVGGKDASKQFWKVSNKQQARRRTTGDTAQFLSSVRRYAAKRLDANSIGRANVVPQRKRPEEIWRQAKSGRGEGGR